MIRIAKSDHPGSSAPRIDSITPEAVLPGGEVEIAGSALGPVAERRPLAVLDGSLAPVLLSRPTRMSIRIPESAEAGRLEVRQNGATSNSVTVKIGKLLAENVNPVASPVVDLEGNVYTTLSGQRGEKMPV
ncbi:MAG TPA: gluconolaconase, partial [Acidobacteriaceae bacterium]